MKQVLYSFLCIFSFSILNAQSLSVQLSKNHYQCVKGAAGIQVISGVQPISLTWSTGESNVFVIDELTAGDYYVHIRDATQKDTIIFFDIKQFLCEVFIENHFTPNGDNYNDDWDIGYASEHPRLKLYVYNKWGQQVHSQSGTYVPWDGKQAGVPVPDGTYYYVFYYEASDEGHYIKGDVTILR